MRKEDIVDICKRIPDKDRSKIQFILITGMMVSVDAFARFEDHYVVFRGREGGQTDDGRGFFVPYGDIISVKLERVVKLSELKMLYGEDSVAERDMAQEGRDAASTQTPLPAIAATPQPSAGPMDPAEIAKQNLLARIRAARTAAGVGAN